MSEEQESASTQRRRTRRSSGEASRSLNISTSPSMAREDNTRKRRKSDKPSKRTRQGFQQVFVDALGWGIFGLWAVGFAIDMLDLIEDWDLPAGIWGLMTIVSGGAFVAQAMSKETKESKRSDEF